MDALWELLVDHAHHRASQPRFQRGDQDLVTKELGALAGDESEPVHRAWDHCMQRYAETGELAWLRGATYLMPLVVRLQRERAMAHHHRLQAPTRFGPRPPSASCEL